MWYSIISAFFIVLSGWVPVAIETSDSQWIATVVILHAQTFALSILLFLSYDYNRPVQKVVFWGLSVYESFSFANILLCLFSDNCCSGIVFYAILVVVFLIFILGATRTKAQDTLDKDKTLLLRKKSDSIFHLLVQSFSCGSLSIYHNGSWYGFKHGEFISTENFDERKYVCEKSFHAEDGLEKLLKESLGSRWSLTNNCFTVIPDAIRRSYDASKLN